MKEILERCDFLGTTPSLNVKGKSLFKTNISGFLSIISILFIITLFFYFTIETFQRKTVIVNSNDKLILNGAFYNFSSDPFVIVSMDGQGNLKKLTDDLIQIRPQVYHFEQKMINGSSVLTVEMTTPKVETCEFNKLGEWGKVFLEAVPDLDLAECFYMDQNITFEGVYGDLTKISRYMDINFVRCINGTKEGVICRPEYEIQEVLKEIFFLPYYVNYYMDSNNINDPFQMYIKSDAFPANYGIFKRFFYYYNKVNYITDYGLLFEDKKTQIQYLKNSFFQNVNLSPGNGFPEGTIATFTLSNGNSEKIYERSYSKLQNLLANLGGIIKGVIVISKTLSYLITRKQYSLFLINDLLLNTNIEQSVKRSIGLDKSELVNNFM